MAVVVYNPTDEEMTATYIGLTDKILPEQKLKVDDARGRSYLNELGPRGLVQLEFGDEGEGVAKKADAGRRKCYEFRRKQILRYNQTNERQKQNGGAYQEPPDYISRWSENLGLKLLEPFAFTDDAAVRMADVKQENLAKDRLLAQKDVEMGELKSSDGHHAGPDEPAAGHVKERPARKSTGAGGHRGRSDRDQEAPGLQVLKLYAVRALGGQELGEHF